MSKRNRNKRRFAGYITRKPAKPGSNGAQLVMRAAHDVFRQYGPVADPERVNRLILERIQEIAPELYAAICKGAEDDGETLSEFMSGLLHGAIEQEWGNKQ